MSCVKNTLRLFTRCRSVDHSVRMNILFSFSIPLSPVCCGNRCNLVKNRPPPTAGRPISFPRQNPARSLPARMCTPPNCRPTQRSAAAYYADMFGDIDKGLSRNLWPKLTELLAQTYVRPPSRCASPDELALFICARVKLALSCSPLVRSSVRSASALAKLGDCKM